MFLRCISYNINEECETFKDLFKIDNKYNDYKENSCSLNMIISTYRDNFQKKRFKPLTFSNLCEILNIENLEQNIGLTLKQSVAFFKKYSLGLFVLDRNYDIVFVFEPTKYNEPITPRALYCVFDNHHIYKLNDEIESLSQIVHNKILKMQWGKNMMNT